MMTHAVGLHRPGHAARDCCADGRLTVDGLSDALEHRSGLLGVSGVSADLREVQAAADAGDRARGARPRRCSWRGRRLPSGLLPRPCRRLDAVVFTGGIGEHAGRVRAAIVERLAVLGVRAHRGVVRPVGDGVLGPVGPGPAVLRVEAREDLVMALEAVAILGCGRVPCVPPGVGTRSPHRGQVRRDTVLKPSKWPSQW